MILLAFIECAAFKHAEMRKQICLTLALTSPIFVVILCKPGIVNNNVIWRCRSFKGRPRRAPAITLMVYLANDRLSIYDTKNKLHVCEFGLRITSERISITSLPYLKIMVTEGKTHYIRETLETKFGIEMRYNRISHEVHIECYASEISEIVIEIKKTLNTSVSCIYLKS
jgi:hypothetical protein